MKSNICLLSPDLFVASHVSSIVITEDPLQPESNVVEHSDADELPSSPSDDVMVPWVMTSYRPGNGQAAVCISSAEIKCDYSYYLEFNPQLNKLVNQK